MKKLILISALFILASCQNWASKEAEKSGKTSAASGRINSSDDNSKNIFKELDE